MACVAAGLLAVGCSPHAPAPVGGVEVRKVDAVSTIPGVPGVILGFTNGTPVAVLIEPSAVIRSDADGAGVDGDREPLPRFHVPDRSQPPLLHLVLEPGEGIAAGVSPIPGTGSCRLEFRCTPGRSGFDGLADAISDRFWSWMDRSGHRSFRGSGFRMAVGVSRSDTGRSEDP